MVPKFHGEKLTDIPDDSLAEILVRLPGPYPYSRPATMAEGNERKERVDGRGRGRSADRKHSQ